MSDGGAYWHTEACKLFRSSFKMLLQRLYHEIDSQFIFLNFKAGFGD